MRDLSKHWMGILIRGIIAILIGAMAIFWPGVGIQVLVLIFGIYAFLDGALALFSGVSLNSVAMVIEGIVGVLVGIYIFFWTEQAVVLFILVIAVWAIVTGIFEIIAGLQLRRQIANEFLLLFVGIVSILFGSLIFIKPAILAVAISFIFGVYALIFGIFLVALAITVKGYKSRTVSKKRRR